MVAGLYGEKKFENIFKIYSKRIFIIDSRGIKISYKQFYESVLKTILILKKKGCKKYQDNNFR